MFPFSDFLSLAIAPASLSGGKGQATGSPHEEKSCISMDARPGLHTPRASESLAAMIIPIERLTEGAERVAAGDFSRKASGFRVDRYPSDAAGVR